MIDEHTIGFGLVELSSLINHLDQEGLLNDDDYKLIKKAESRIMEITGFTNGG